jgi:muramoyltetrapeptide carboxypeptidase
MSTDPIVVKADAAEVTHPVRVAGRAEGIVIGGNLSLLAASVGTVDQPDLTGAILLLEEIEEAPYRVDRLLLQLRRSGTLNGIRGVAIGQFTNCGVVVPVLTADLATLGVPVLGGLPVGHGEQHLAVPLGTPAVLDADAGTLTVSSATTG